ncbi:MAG: thioredoxin fold domain-containing protein [Clostridia bacterium]|nr:thioredoxin fold domain-containing protein [Clostridia bacterium]
MNKKGLLIFLLIIISVMGYKFIFQNQVSAGQLAPAPNAAETLQKALGNGKPTFLQFTSENCPACREAAPWIEEIYQTYKNEVNFILADVNKGGSSLAQQLGVMAVPTFVYFDHEGNIVEAFAGYPATGGKKYLEDKFKMLLP